MSGDTTTESQARKKWCPMVRALALHEGKVVGVGANAGLKMRSDPDNKYARCIASDCMMWRWQRVDVSTRNEDMPGHCGLAGAPWSALP